MINLNFNTVNRRLAIDLFGPHHVSTADDERMSEIEQAFEADNCTDFWLGSYTFIDFQLTRSWEMSDIWKRKKFGEVLEAFGPDGPRSCTRSVFPLPLEGQELTVPKPRKTTRNTEKRS